MTDGGREAAERATKNYFGSLEFILFYKGPEGIKWELGLVSLLPWKNGIWVTETGIS